MTGVFANSLPSCSTESFVSLMFPLEWLEWLDDGCEQGSRGRYGSLLYTEVGKERGRKLLRAFGDCIILALKFMQEVPRPFWAVKGGPVSKT